MKKICFVTLGCDKNKVDSETILGFLYKNNFSFTQIPSEADAIIINTCGFIESAKKESLDAIFKYAKYHKKLIVVGCLVERYLEELKLELSDVVDLFVPLSNYKNLRSELLELFPNEIKCEYNPYYRVFDTPSYSAYLKISEGCNHFCAFCAIPLIRGRFHSVEKEELLKQANEIASSGVKELIIVSQDTSNYGTDLYKDYGIVSLLKDILNINKFKYIRLLYLYAHEVNDELISLIKENSSVLLPYFDIPLQHASNKIIKAMNRRDTKEEAISLIHKIRKEIPQSIIRTTFIVGFPGESEEDFNELLDFVKEARFDHLGAFTYSCEEGTKAATFSDQVSEKTKKKRYETLLKNQMSISYEQNKKHIGEVMKGLVIALPSGTNNKYTLRSYFNAPDDIDGEIYFTSNINHKLGDIVKVKISSCDVYDLEGIEVDNT